MERNYVTVTLCIPNILVKGWFVQKLLYRHAAKQAYHTHTHTHTHRSDSSTSTAESKITESTRTLYRRIRERSADQIKTATNICDDVGWLITAVSVHESVDCTESQAKRNSRVKINKRRRCRSISITFPRCRHALDTRLLESCELLNAFCSHVTVLN